MLKFRRFLLSMIQNRYSDTWEQQLKFYCNPDSLMNEFRLTDTQKSILCTLDPTVVWREIKKDGYLTNHPRFKRNFDEFWRRVNETTPQWPDMGADHLLRDPWDTANADNPCGGTPCCDEHPPKPGDGDDPHPMWAGPKAKIVCVLDPHAQLGTTKDLKIVGEGFLPYAEITLRHHDHPSSVIVQDASEYVVCNIRRTYLRAQVPIPPTGVATGSYDVIVNNVGWNHPLESLNSLEIRS